MFSIILVYSGLATHIAAETDTMRSPATTVAPILRTTSKIPSATTPKPNVTFSWGDVGWLPALALDAGWPVETHGKLGQVILRESGGCPNRRGGDKVDKECNITGVSEWNHRSDSGLLQINGINYDPTRNEWAPLCLQMKVCTQEPLMDARTNLKAGKLLFDYWQKAAGDGWIPWNICNRSQTCGKP